MDMNGLLIGLALAGAVICLGLAMASLWRRRQPDWRRLEELAKEGGRRSEAPPSRTLLKKMVTGFLASLSAAARPQKPWEMSRLRRELLLAGFHAPSAVNVYLGVKVISLALLPLALFASPLTQRLQGNLLPLALLGRPAWDS